MEFLFRKVVDDLSDETIIEDFDRMFNSGDEVNVLKIMSSVAKAKRFGQSDWDDVETENSSKRMRASLTMKCLK